MAHTCINQMLNITGHLGNTNLRQRNSVFIRIAKIHNIEGNRCLKG